jgi:hypothetical protein
MNLAVVEQLAGKEQRFRIGRRAAMVVNFGLDGLAVRILPDGHTPTKGEAREMVPILDGIAALLRGDPTRMRVTKGGVLQFKWATPRQKAARTRQKPAGARSRVRRTRQ